MRGHFFCLAIVGILIGILATSTIAEVLVSGGDVEALAAASGIEAFGGDGFNGAATIVAVMGGQFAPRSNRIILYP